jgi:hypothetical protein
MFVQLPVTVLGLAGCCVDPRNKLFRNLVVANTVVGFLYMHNEYEALHTHGSVLLGIPVKLSRTRVHNVVCNVLLHLVLSTMVLKYGNSFPAPRPPIAHAVVLYAAGLALLDLRAMYPTQSGLTEYILLHALVFFALIPHSGKRS